MQLEGKVAVITGAGTGIGEATAKLFAKEGAKVVLLARTEEDLRETLNEIEQNGGTGLIVPTDVSKPQEMQNAVTETIQQYGRIDVLFANAGINGLWAPIEEIEPDEWDETLDINLKGTFLALKYCVPALRRQGGSVIVTASVNGTRIFSNAGATAYSCSKAAQVALTKMAALELAQDKIRVNVVCPGAITTEIEETAKKRDVADAKVAVNYPEGKIPLTGGKPGSAEQVAQLVLFLASENSSHITGTEVWIDGAESLLQG